MTHVIPAHRFSQMSSSDYAHINSVRLVTSTLRDQSKLTSSFLWTMLLQEDELLIYKTQVVLHKARK